MSYSFHGSPNYWPFFNELKSDLGSAAHITLECKNI